MPRLALLFVVTFLTFWGWSAAQATGNGAIEIYKRSPGVETRWVSFENIDAAKGQGGKENLGAKGHAFDFLERGETKTLLDIEGSGTIRRIWMTMRPRNPEALRALRLDMFWDNAEEAAVSVPVGDFFCWILGRPTAFENELFSNPEARSFVCFVPMPFRSAARVTITNESDKDLSHLFYDIDLTLGEDHEDSLYFHAHWRRERWTTLGEDFEILPKVEGDGRFLGCHIGVIVNPKNKGWWGEGEVKVYLDGDTEFPTLVGTGAEDYIGTAWGQGVYAHRFQGCLVTDAKKGHYTFYRYHIPDPVYFQEDCRVTIQQIGGTQKKEVIQMLKDGVPVKPVSINNGGFTKLLDVSPALDLEDESLPDGWVNYYRQDDFSAVAFFYLDSPASNLPELAPVEERTEAIE